LLVIRVYFVGARDGRQHIVVGSTLLVTRQHFKHYKNPNETLL